MIEITAREIARATGATVIAGDVERSCAGVAIDSREVGDGTIFVAFPGEKVDGNTYATSAVASGAGCVVITSDPVEGLEALAVKHGAALLRAADDDPTEFMLRLTEHWRQGNDWTVVGVTGSVGKTTTKDMLECALSTRFRVHATRGNFNNLIGVPLTMLSASPEDEVLVVEMGMNHAGELERLSRVARPQVALVTNVGTSHIGFLGSKENIARAKAEIITGMMPSSEAGPVASRLFLCGEDGFTPLIAAEYAQPAGVDVELVGTAETDSVRASGVRLDGNGFPGFRVEFADGWAKETSCQVPGAAVVTDFLMAMAVSGYLGCDRDSAAAALEAMQPSHMRLEQVEAACGVSVIDDSYNASPASMGLALDVLSAKACEGRRIAVLGEMGELGDEAPRLHALVGAYAAAKPLDMLVVVGTHLADAIAEGAIDMGMSEDKIERFETVDEALSVMGPELAAGDLVLAKASRASGLDTFVKGVLDR